MNIYTVTFKYPNNGCEQVFHATGKEISDKFITFKNGDEVVGWVVVDQVLSVICVPAGPSTMTSGIRIYPWGSVMN